MTTKAYRSYLSFTAPDELITQVASTIKKEGLKEAKKGNISKLEIYKRSYREDIVIGDLYIIPASVCKNAADFPIALLAAGAFQVFNQEEKIEAKLQVLASDDMSKDTLKMAKDMLFTDKEGNIVDLIVFHPAWANLADMKIIQYREASLEQDLRDKVFSAQFNPSLSSVMSQIKALTGAYRVDSIPVEQHLFKMAITDPDFPELTKGSEAESKNLIVNKDNNTSKTIGQEAKKELGIKTTFRLIASSLVKAEETEVRKKIRLSAAHINELEESVLDPEELKLFNKLDDIVDRKISSETGLRNREDYGAPGSKEQVSSETIDGPDPKTAADIEADAKTALDYIRLELKKLDKSDNENESAKYDKLDSERHVLEDFLRSGGNKGSMEAQDVIYKYVVGVKSKEVDDVKSLPGKTMVSSDTEVKVEMSEPSFIKEHENLVNILEHGSKEELHEEAIEQGNELEEVLHDADSETESEDIPMDANDWFIPEYEEHHEASKSKLAITLLVPGQVLEGFYPELAEQLQIQPVGREYDHSPTPEELQLSLDKEDAGDSTKSPAGIGLGPNEPQGVGAPLRKELNLRGPGFTNTFYGPHDDINPSSLMVASVGRSKRASVANKAKLGEVLKKICGQIAGTFIGAFSLTKRPIFTDVPTELEINLEELESSWLEHSLPVSVSKFGFKALASDLNDSDMIDIINSAWAQAAIWNDEGDSGFTYEVFVRTETLDIEDMKMKVKYIIKRKD